MDLNSFVEWSRNNPQCEVEIKVGGSSKKDAGKVKEVWVYSYAQMCGKYVKSVNEIDFDQWEREKMDAMRAMVERYFEKEAAAE